MEGVRENLPGSGNAVLVRLANGCGVRKTVFAYEKTDHGLFVSFSDAPDLYVPYFPELFIHDFGGVC